MKVTWNHFRTKIEYTPPMKLVFFASIYHNCNIFCETLYPNFDGYRQKIPNLLNRL